MGKSASKCVTCKCVTWIKRSKSGSQPPSGKSASISQDRFSTASAGSTASTDDDSFLVGASVHPADFAPTPSPLETPQPPGSCPLPLEDSDVGSPIPKVLEFSLAESPEASPDVTLRSAAATQDDELSLRPLEAMLGEPSAATDGRRMAEWRKCSDRNLFHIFRFCQEYAVRGKAREQPDTRVRGIDFLMSQRHLEANQLKLTDATIGGTRTICPHAKLLGEEAQRVEGILHTSDFFLKMETKAPGVVLDLASKVKVFQEDPGQLIFRQGDPGESMYVIACGEVAVHKKKFRLENGKPETEIVSQTTHPHTSECAT